MTCLIDLDGTVLNIWDRLYSIFDDSFVAGHLELPFQITKPEYILMRREGMSDKMILNLNGTMDTKTYLSYRRGVIESKYYLALDTLFDIEKLYQFDRRILITYRKNRKNLMNQLENLKIHKFFTKIITPENSIPIEKFKYDSIKKYKEVNSRVIGDTEIDILSAEENGICSIGVLSGLTNRVRMENINPDGIINDISEL